MPMQAVILANRRAGETPLALRRVCGIPLIRRQLQVMGTQDWRRAIVILCPQDQRGVQMAIGDPGSLGMQVSYLTVPIEDHLPAESLMTATEGNLLILEGHYVIEAVLLESLVRAGCTAVLCDDEE